MAQRPYRHIIWDWNGTLFEDAWLCMDVMNGLLRRRRLPILTAERYQAAFTFPVVNYYRQLGFDFARESFEELGTEFMADYERRRLECGLRDHAREILAGVQASGLTQSVLSAYKRETLEELLRHFEVRPFFLCVIGSDDHYASGKVAQGLQLIRELDVAPEEVLLIGDTVHDFEVAHATGTGCWLIPGGNHSRARLEACGVPVLDSLREVAQRLFHSPLDSTGP
jgi:phosphoglycolate phosphatase